MDKYEFNTKPLNDAELEEYLNEILLNGDVSEDEYEEDVDQIDYVDSENIVNESETDSEKNENISSNFVVDQVEACDRSADDIGSNQQTTEIPASESSANNSTIVTSPSVPSNSAGNVFIDNISTSAADHRATLRNLVWKKKHLIVNESQLLFQGSSELSLEILALDSP
jgi:hypothetical protein